MNRRNVLQWQLMFQKGRTDIHNDECKRVTEHAVRQNCGMRTLFLKMNVISLSLICDEMATHFSRETGEATIVCALQQLEM